jgi:hypothetical protein
LEAFLSISFLGSVCISAAFGSASMLLPSQIYSNITLAHAVPAAFESVFWSLNFLTFFPYALNDAFRRDFFNIQNALESDFINKKCFGKLIFKQKLSF